MGRLRPDQRVFESHSKTSRKKAITRDEFVAFVNCDMKALGADFQDPEFPNNPWGNRVQVVDLHDESLPFSTYLAA
jgi:hypothetical protein